MIRGIKLICFYGPESTGKSTMARRMAGVYETEFVPEVAREFVSSNNFSVEEIIHIGQAQTQRTLEKLKTANKFLFCDTDLITTEIYSQHYLGVIPPILYKLEEQIVYDRYFFFDIDLPWVADGLRDLGEKRKEMFQIFRTELEKRHIEYFLVSGSQKQREEIIRAEIDRMTL